MVGGGWTVFRTKGEWSGIKDKGSGKKEGVFSLPHFGRQGACHDIAKSADSQKNIIFSENDCIIAEILEKQMTSDWGS